MIESSALEDLPECPEAFSSELTRPLEEFAGAWVHSDERPSPDPEVLKEWNSLLENWIAEEDLPLLVRRSKSRGHLIQHESGRMVVPADNSPATWVYGLALQGQCPTVEGIRSAFDADEIPIAFIQGGEERRDAKFERTLASRENLNKEDWKLAHIHPIGLGEVEVSKIDKERLEAHFQEFLSPVNMFLIPQKWSGLGEIPEVLTKMREHLSSQV